MRLLLASLLVLLPILISSCRTEAREVQTRVESMPDALNTMNEIVVKKMEFKIIKCPSYLVGRRFDKTVNLEQRCFVAAWEPEDILVGLSEEFKKIGKVGMQWRFDIGHWLTSYRLSGGNFTLLVTLQAPGNSILMQDDPTVNNYKTVGTFIISDEK